MAGAPLDLGPQLGRAQRQGCAFGRGDVDLEGLLAREDRVDPGALRERGLDVDGQGRSGGVAKLRAEEDQVLLLAAGVPGEALGAGFPDEGEDAIAHQAAEADEGLVDLLSGHALDGIAADRPDGAQLRQVPPSGRAIS
jgi:hypothetical protein